MTISASQLVGSSGTWHKQEFLSSGTFTVPTGVTRIYVSGCAGGGGGATSGNSSYYAYGGGSGQGVYQNPRNVSPGSSISITIGSGGSAPASAGNGKAGGRTLIGNLVLFGGHGGAYQIGPGLGGGSHNQSSALPVALHIINGATGGYSFGPNQPGNNKGGAGGMYGRGGDGLTSSSAASTPAANSGAGGGSGGGGGGSAYGAGTNGASGRVVIEWIAQ